MHHNIAEMNNIFVNKGCDGQSLKVGQWVKIRLSRLGDYAILGRNETNRSGQIVNLDPKVGIADVRFTDGTTYVVYQNVLRNTTPPAPKFVDCDGNEVRVGSRVKVRLSALTQYTANGITEETRFGVVKDLVDNVITMRFDTPHYGFVQQGYVATFPRKHIRRVSL